MHACSKHSSNVFSMLSGDAGTAQCSLGFLKQQVSGLKSNAKRVSQLSGKISAERKHLCRLEHAVQMSFLCWNGMKVGMKVGFGKKGKLSPVQPSVFMRLLLAVWDNDPFRRCQRKSLESMRLLRDLQRNVTGRQSEATASTVCPVLTPA